MKAPGKSLSGSETTTWAVSPKLTAQLDVVNGWQNISENNSGKGAGVRLDFTPSATTTVSYYNFFSDEAGTRLRTFNGVGAKVSSGRATLLGELDLGTQGKSTADNGTASWYGFTAVARLCHTTWRAIRSRRTRIARWPGFCVGLRDCVEKQSPRPRPFGGTNAFTYTK